MFCAIWSCSPRVFMSPFDVVLFCIFTLHPHRWISQQRCFFFGKRQRVDRMEPQCITCDIDSIAWSRRLYTNCTYFEAYLSPMSSIATDYRIEQYVLECQGPILPVAGKSNSFPSPPNTHKQNFFSSRKYLYREDSEVDRLTIHLLAYIR